MSNIQVVASILTGFLFCKVSKISSARYRYDCWSCGVVDTVIPSPIQLLCPGKGAISIAFVHPSVRLSVCPSVAHIENNSRTQRPSVPKFGMKVPHLRCDSHTSFKVKRSFKGQVTDGRGIPCRPNPAAKLLVCLMCICGILSLARSEARRLPTSARP